MTTKNMQYAKIIMQKWCTQSHDRFNVSQHFSSAYKGELCRIFILRISLQLNFSRYELMPSQRCFSTKPLLIPYQYPSRWKTFTTRSSQLSIGIIACPWFPDQSAQVNVQTHAIHASVFTLNLGPLQSSSSYTTWPLLLVNTLKVLTYS